MAAAIFKPAGTSPEAKRPLHAHAPPLPPSTRSPSRRGPRNCTRIPSREQAKPSQRPSHSYRRAGPASPRAHLAGRAGHARRVRMRRQTRRPTHAAAQRGQRGNRTRDARRLATRKFQTQPTRNHAEPTSHPLPRKNSQSKRAVKIERPAHAR